LLRVILLMHFMLVLFSSFLPPGSVYYDVTNFLEKNKDAIHADTKSMVLKSSVPFVASLMAEKADSAG